MSQHAEFIKETHKTLRTCVKLKGEKHAKSVWLKHLRDKKQLKKYALSMVQLATLEWETKKDLKSRLNWIYEQIIDYFHNGKGCDKYEKEQRKASYSNIETIEQWKVKLPTEQIIALDVGSCYNPFSKFEKLKVTAIDICPASPDVYPCDFLSVEIIKKMESSVPIMDEKRDYLINIEENITKMTEKSVEAVIFSFFLEYIPSPKMRLDCCIRAYNLLKPNGLLCIATPDSKSQNSNAQFFKFWKVALSLIGFQRIKYEKYEHFHGMIFRKGIYPQLWHADALREFENLKLKAIKEKFKFIELENIKTSLYILQDFTS